MNALRFGPWRARLAPPPHLGVIVLGLDHDDGATAAPADYVNDVLLAPPHRDVFFAAVDAAGLVVCRNVGGDDALHEDVRGRSSRGRLSQGEHYHHDGCSGPTKPRVVEIRCPYQPVARSTATAIAPFPETVHAMLHELPAELRAEPQLAAWHAALVTDGALPAALHDTVQGAINRMIRVAMPAETARAYFRAVDDRAGAYRAPWTFGESRFIANDNGARTMQHRRAYLEAPGRANGKLVKRWPAEAPVPSEARTCARGAPCSDED